MRKLSVKGIGATLLIALGSFVVFQLYQLHIASAESHSHTLNVISNQLQMEFNVLPAQTDDRTPQGNDPVATSEEFTVVVDNGDGSGVATATIRRTTNPDGSKSDNVTFKAEQAKETVGKARQSGQTTARIVISDEKDEVSRLDITIPKDAATELAMGGLSLEIYTENAKIILPNDSLIDIAEDLYFRVIPIKNESARTEVEDRARVERIVREVAGNNRVDVVARPMTIETNLSSRAVDIVLPLLNVTLPTDEKERAAFLADLVIFIEHSDGDRQLVKPQVVDYKDGRLGLKFGIHKFSTFTILNMEGWGEYLKAQEASNQHSAYMQGYPDRTFKPDRGISRAEMATILYRIDAGAAFEDGTKMLFPDAAASHWSHLAIQYISSKGLMVGLPDGKFKPEQAVTRAEIAAIVSRWLKLEGDADASFEDTAGNWAENEISLVKQSGIIEGYPDGSFHPEKLLTRAEAVTIINKILNRGSQDWSTSTWGDVPTTHWAFKDIEEASNDHQYTISADDSESIVK